jgi:hypothetical protein
MRLREFINTDREYTRVEQEIKAWVEKSYPGLSIEFTPHLEIVQTDPKRHFKSSRVKRITEAVNIKIGDVMERNAERIYIAERLDRIYKNHPEFDLEVESIADIKTSPLFLQYLSELIIRE